MTTVLDTLVAGRARIEHGWCKKHYTKKVFGRQCYCAVGAVDDGVADLTWHLSIEARAALHKALPPDAPVGRFGDRTVVAYNDHPATTKADVLALYDRAIERERLQQDGR